MGTSVTRHGPWFDGRAKAAIRDFVNDAEREIAETGEGMVVATLGQVLQHPTGYYASRVQTVQRGSVHQVNDGGVVYGPWLEGEGSRNAPKTRFRGYRHWRLTTQRLTRKAPQIAQRLLGRYLRRMG